MGSTDAKSTSSFDFRDRDGFQELISGRPNAISGTFNRRVFVASSLIGAAAMVGANVGCQNLVKRGQSPDGDIVSASGTRTPVSTRYVAAVCKMAGLRGEKVEGIALITQLKSTGSAAKPGELRKRLERDLERLDLEINTDTLLKSKDTEIVLCRSFLPPGVRKGDLIDLEVQGLRDTSAKSLENGFAIHTRLQDTAKLGNTIKEGHLKAIGRGRVLTDALFETRSDADALQGVILGGGRSNVDRDLTLIMRKGSTSVRNATQISAALNQRFTISSANGLKSVAEAKTDQFIELKIPDQYRRNVGRYAQVVSNLAFGESSTDRVNRLDQLGQQMNDPVACGLAAVRLEGMGQQAVPTLIQSLRSPQVPTRFYAAQALAYLGKDDGVAVLRDAAVTEPAFRWHALTALATLDNVQSEQALVGLLNENDAETRCGAFRALRLQNPSHPVVQSQWLANDHHLCVVDNGSDPLLHFSQRERAEILIVNDTQIFSDRFLYVESGLTVKSNGDGTVSVANYTAQNNDKTICSDRVSDVLQTVAQSGRGYATLLRMARKATQEGTLNSRLEIDALPKVGRQYQADVVETKSDIIDDRNVKRASWWSSVKERFAR
jgi:hypothetical protein